MIRLIATDLDGTLLREDGSISERTQHVLEAARAAQITTVMVTARPPRTVRAIAHRLHLGGLAICCNGALVYDLDQNQITAHTPLTAQTARSLVLALREAIPGVHFAVEHGVSYSWESGFASRSPVLPDDQPSAEADALELCSGPITKLLVLHEHHAADDLLRIARELVGETAHVTHSGATFVEISAAGVQKAWAVAELCAELAIDSSEVVAFGDMPNDIPMLTWAGLGVAVANAHPDVQTAADEITLTNEQDGVAVVVERILQHQAI